jgi:hypothetical protein
MAGFLPGERAERVCCVCKARKKGCDKQLPQCGYCSKRGLICSYIDASGYQSSDVASNSSVDHSICTSSDPAALRNTLFLQVRRVLQDSGRTLHQLSRHFFQTFHFWIPTISPRLFYDTVLAANNGTLPVGCSLVVLGMHLIVQHHLSGSDDGLDSKDAWITLKMLHAQAQTILSPSISLVQSGFLIATFEFAHGQLQAACVSIATCIRLAEMMGFARIAKTHHDLAPDHWSIFKALEQRNLWWAIVIMER